MFREGEDWVVLVEKEEYAGRRTLTRRIVSLRKLRKRCRRDDEVHRVRLYEPSEISGRLRRAGFQTRMIRAYGRYPLAKGHAAFVVRKAGVR
jgi:hypothetical protein